MIWQDKKYANRYVVKSVLFSTDKNKEKFYRYAKEKSLEDFDNLITDFIKVIKPLTYEEEIAVLSCCNAEEIRAELLDVFDNIKGK